MATTKGIGKLGVIGAGTMGAGIAQVAAMAGIEVLLRDVDMKFVDAAVKRMEDSLDKSVAKGKLTAQAKAETLGRIAKSSDIADFREADLVIEAVLEDAALKISVFLELNEVCPESTIFATNTSSISITEIAAGSGRADRFCGIHFFNPVPMMRLVEIISGLNSSQATLEAAAAFAAAIGKTSVLVKKDSPGFIVNRLLIPYMNEAARLLSEGVASVEDIDTAVKLGLNHPMGPFELLDMGGVELAITILNYFREEFGDAGYAPQYLLKQMARAGKKGRKSGEGFYKYPG